MMLVNNITYKVVLLLKRSLNIRRRLFVPFGIMAKRGVIITACLSIIFSNVFTPEFARAVTVDQNFYAGNDILFYDPNACGGSNSSATSTPATPPISGSGTIDEKIAKMFIVGFNATDTAGMDAAVSKYKIGGLFFHGDSGSSLNKAFFDGLNQKAGSPLLISSDDEGGKITRFIPDAPSAATMGTWDDAKIEAQGKKVGDTLKAAGVTSALAPVLDLNGGNTIWTQLQRDWSDNPDVVAQKASAWARGLKSAGVNPVYKHFPGLGHINVNTDISPAPPVSLASLQNDIKPFQALSSQNGGALMLGNMFISDWNGGLIPVSTSGDAVKYVRDTVKFNGVVMTDDLSAKYIAGGNLPQAVATAVEAGVDMPLFTGNETTVKQAIDAVKTLPDAQAKVDAALQRVTAYKTNLIATAPAASTCCASGGGGGSTLSGDNNLAKIYNYFSGKGLTPEQVSGIIGNMMHESGLAPQRLETTGLNDITPADQVHAGGWGIVQWTPASKMIGPTKAAGKDPNDLSVQLDFLWNELNTNEKGALDGLKAATTPEAAADAFLTGYERPKIPEATRALRETSARAIFENSKGTPLPPGVAAGIFGGAGGSPSSSSSTPTASTTTTASSSCSGSGSASVDGYKNPFRDLKNSGPLRLDGGLDYGGPSGSGPVYAVGNAKVVLVQASGSGWPGVPGSYTVYQLTDGAAQGKYIYIAEDCTPKVKVGDVITPDTVVCDYVQKDAFLEIGWSEGGNQYIKWSDYPGHGSESYASNSGQDISKFLVKLGTPAGLVQGPLSNKTPPADWPKW